VDVQGAVHSALLLITFPQPTSSLATRSAPAFQPIFCPAAGGIGGEKEVFQPRVKPALCDFTIARNWLRSSQRHHEPCGMRPALAGGMKLIDCKTLDIVQADENSIVRWGKVRTPTTQCNRHRYHAAPAPKLVRNHLLYNDCMWLQFVRSSLLASRHARILHVMCTGIWWAGSTRR
jgi:hypothetical protein